MPEPEAPNQGNPEPESTPTAPSEASGEQGQQPEKAEFFSETFDPASLPDELRPAYQQMRNAFSQKTQTVAEERRQLREAQELYEALQDPEKQADALSRLGIELEDDEEDLFEEEENPYEQRLSQIEQLLQAQHQTAEQQQLEEAEHAYIVAGLQELQTKTGREFSDEELDTIGILSERLRDAEGLPDVEAAYERIYATVLPKERERWADQKKKAPQAPRGSAAASESPDLDTERGRIEFMRQRLAATADE